MVKHFADVCVSCFSSRSHISRTFFSDYAYFTFDYRAACRRLSVRSVQLGAQYQSGWANAGYSRQHGRCGIRFSCCTRKTEVGYSSASRPRKVGWHAVVVFNNVVPDVVDPQSWPTGTPSFCEHRDPTHRGTATSGHRSGSAVSGVPLRFPDVRKRSHRGPGERLHQRLPSVAATYAEFQAMKISVAELRNDFLSSSQLRGAGSAWRGYGAWQVGNNFVESV